MNDDTISRREAIDALWEALYEYEDKTKKQFQESDELDVEDWILHRAFVQNMSDIDRRTILDLPSAQQWIPCERELPTPNSCYDNVSVYYLVQNEYGDMMVATFVQFPGGARVWQQMYQDGAIMEDIVAWMPLPECYKGES